MKSNTKNIFRLLVALFTIFGAAALTSCDSDSPQFQFPGTETAVSKPIQPAKVEITVVEGHLHTHCNPVGDVFWANTNGGFHANPILENDAYPLKREQIITYTLQPDGTYKQSGEDAIRLLTTHEPGTKGGGHQYALVVKMFDKNGKRLDREYCQPDMSERVQVFYIPKNVAPLGPDRPLTKAPGAYRPDSLFYYWYFDRISDINVTRNSPVLRSPVGFRGAFINLQGIMKYDVDMMVTILPEGHTKNREKYTNSVTMSPEQQKNIVFKLTIPFRNVAEDITPFKSPEMPQEVFDKIQEEDGLRMYDNLHKESGMSINDILTAARKRAFLNAETSQFWL